MHVIPGSDPRSPARKDPGEIPDQVRDDEGAALISASLKEETMTDIVLIGGLWLARRYGRTW